jgi:4-oxalocrotonate tautomerase
LQLTYVSIKSNANTTEFTMPMITVRYATAQRKSGLTEMIAKAASRLSVLTAVTVEQIAPEDWFIGDKSLTRHGLASFWLDIRIVDGTNTREEKAAFVAATFAKMSELLGPLHNESYVHVNDVRGDAYGYGGLTQNERYFAGKMKAPNAAAA